MDTTYNNGWVRMAADLIETAPAEDRYRTTRMLMRSGAIVNGHEPTIDLNSQTITFLGETSEWDTNRPTESFLTLCRKITND